MEKPCGKKSCKGCKEAIRDEGHMIGCRFLKEKTKKAARAAKISEKLNKKS